VTAVLSQQEELLRQGKGNGAMGRKCKRSNAGERKLSKDNKLDKLLLLRPTKAIL